MSSRMLRPEGHQHLCRVARSAFFIAARAAFAADRARHFSVTRVTGGGPSKP